MPPGFDRLVFLLISRNPRQEFLFYYEKENGIKSQMVERMKSGPRTCVIASPPCMSAFFADETRTSARTQLVKQTYSVNVHNPGSENVRKWHLSEYSFPLVVNRLLIRPPDAYYCADEVEDLATVDDHEKLKNLQVPHELYTCARTSRAREAAIRSHNNPGMRGNREPPRILPPFHYHPRPEDLEHRSFSGSDSSSRDRSSSPDPSLAPLEYLESLPRLGRHPMDDRALRMFDSASNLDM